MRSVNFACVDDVLLSCLNISSLVPPLVNTDASVDKSAWSVLIGFALRTIPVLKCSSWRTSCIKQQRHITVVIVRVQLTYLHCYRLAQHCLWVNIWGSVRGVKVQFRLSLTSGEHVVPARRVTMTFVWSVKRRTMLRQHVGQPSAVIPQCWLAAEPVRRTFDDSVDDDDWCRWWRDNKLSVAWAVKPSIHRWTKVLVNMTQCALSRWRPMSTSPLDLWRRITSTARTWLITRPCFTCE